MAKNILITGAAGFLGSHLIDSLLKEDVQIRALDLNVPDANCDKLIWIKKDILRDDLSEVFKGVDIVYHLAGKYSPGNSDEILKNLNKLNVVGTGNVAKAASLAGVKKVIHISSIAACEESKEKIITEDSGLPVTSYGLSKLESEKNLISNLSRNTKYIIVRPVAFFGENHKGSIYELVKVIKNKKFVLIGKGNNCVNFLYVKDLVEVLITTGLDVSISNETYIVSDNPVSLKQLVRIIKQKLAIKETRFYIPRPIGMGIGVVFDVFSFLARRRLPISARRVNAMTKNVTYSNEKIKKIVPIFKYGVEKGLIRTIDWYKSSGLIY
jgi:nucleoside-diphosphate-sugar epimerase